VLSRLSQGIRWPMFYSLKRANLSDAFSFLIFHF
jgi:hypothetical protein